MPEQAERHQPQKKDYAQLQAEEITPELESLQVDTYQSATSPPPITEPPDDPNSWQGIQSRLGNQQLQHLLNNAPIQLHRNTIHQLHSTIGNQAVQRLLLHKTSLVPHISSRASNLPLVQRRVPELEDIDDEALETDSDEDNEINRRGLQEVLRRAIQDLGEPRSTYILDMNYNGNYIRDTLATGTTEHLMDVVRLIENNDFTGADGRSLVFEDTTSTAVPVSRSSNYPQVQQAINRISDLLIEIGTSSTHDQHLQAVFGNDAQYGWQAAKARFPRTGQELRRALSRNHIRYDQTGASDEVGAGGSTLFAQRIIVTAACVDNPDTAEALRVYSHEAFHYAYSDILDDGGYRRSNPGFDTESPQTRFLNADHYGEVCRRANGGGDDLPARDRIGVRTQAVDIVRQAWSLATYIFETFRDQYNRQQHGRRVSSRMVNTLLHHSILFELTYHQRHRDRNTPINEIDLTLAEGVARRLSEAIDCLNQLSDSSVRQAVNDGQVTAMFGVEHSYIELAMININGITSSYTRDARMVRYLADLGDSISRIQNMPPDYLQ